MSAPDGLTPDGPGPDDTGPDDTAPTRRAVLEGVGVAVVAAVGGFAWFSATGPTGEDERDDEQDELDDRQDELDDRQDDRDDEERG